jgi:hypothetical protein
MINQIDKIKKLLRLSKSPELKTWPEQFEALNSGNKTCEVRKDDRGFEVSDMLNLREWLPDKEQYTGRVLWFRVTHILRGSQWGLRARYVAMSVMRAL